MPKRLWIDFNDVDEDALVHTLLDFAGPGVEVAVGEAVTVADDEGNSAPGSIRAIRPDGTVTIAVDLDAFVPADDRSNTYS